MYAEITENIFITGDYVNLYYKEAPYFNKPPLFFWLQALSRKALGWNEMALRLPSVLCSFGTMILTYAFGVTLFSRTVGFWASLVVGTSYASVWFGELAIIDPILTFCMTLGLLGFARAYFSPGAQWYYLLGFVALAVGAMVKNFHAFAMPLLLFLVLLWVFRDPKPLKAVPFWTGAVVFVALLGGFYAFLGPEYWRHFLFQENLIRMTKLAGDTQGSALEAYFGSRPIFWYAFIIWFDFFPWSALLPSCMLLMWRNRPFRRYPRETFLLFWVIGYFLAFSLLPEKHERYLMPLVPAVGLMVGYLYHCLVGKVDIPGLKGRETTVMTIMLGILSVALIALALLGPSLLQRKWHVAPDVVTVIYQVVIVLCAAGLMYFLRRSQLRMALNMVGVVAVILMLGVVVLIVPGINAVASPKLIYTEVKSALRHPMDPIRTFQHWHWRHDEDQYYWRAVHKYDRILAEGLGDAEALEVLKAEIHDTGPVVIMMTEGQYQQIVEKDPELVVQVLRKFLRPNVTIFLLLIEFKA